MVHKTLNSNTGASDKAIKKEVQAKGLGVPQSTGVSHGTEVFEETPVRNDDLQTLPSETSAPDSVTRVGEKVAPGGAMEVTGGAITQNVPPETQY